MFRSVTDNVSAQRKERVSFPRGVSGVTLKGTVTGYGARDYIVRASKAQTLELRLTGTNEMTVFTAFLPNGQNLEGATEMDEFNDVLPADGDYMIRVMVMRAARCGPQERIVFEIHIKNFSKIIKLEVI